MKKRNKILLAIGFLILIVGSIGYYQFTRKVPTLDNVKADYIITATDLYNGFETDEAAATNKYEGKVIEVSGKIISIMTDGEQNNLILEAENSMMGSVNCSIKEPIEGLKVDDNVVVKGRCQGFLMDVILNNGYVVK